MTKHFTQASFTTMLWKNGQGTTTELFRLPDPAAPEDFLLRISVATVTGAGPFSLFPGIDRTLLVLDGTGARLRSDGRPAVDLLRTSAPFEFPGELELACDLLGGPVTDFNVMLKRGFGSAEVRKEEVRAPGKRTVDCGGDLRFLYRRTAGGASELWQLSPAEAVTIEAHAGDQLVTVGVRKPT